jgi:hypothetical protein
MFGFARTGRVGVARGGGSGVSLQRMGDELGGTDHVAAIYIAKRAPDRFGAAAFRGRIAGVVRLAPMPPGRTMLDYFETAEPADVGRWPLGWPVAAWLRFPEPEPPRLDDLARSLCGDHAWRTLYPLLQGGRPVRVAGESPFAALGAWLTYYISRHAAGLVSEHPRNVLCS